VARVLRTTNLPDIFICFALILKLHDLFHVVFETYETMKIFPDIQKVKFPDIFIFPRPATLIRTDLMSEMSRINVIFRCQFLCYYKVGVWPWGLPAQLGVNRREVLLHLVQNVRFEGITTRWR